MQEWIIPVEWTTYSTVKVEATTAEEALKIFNEKIDELPLPIEKEYVDGSFQLASHDCTSDASYIKICQEYVPISSITVKANGEITN